MMDKGGENDRRSVFLAYLSFHSSSASLNKFLILLSASPMYLHEKEINMQ